MVKVWRPDGFEGLELVKGHLEKASPDQTLHSHEAYQVGVITCGAKEFVLRGGKQVVAAGAFTAVQPDEIHTSYALEEDGASFELMLIHPEAFSTVLEPATGRTHSLPRLPLVLSEKRLTDAY